MGGGQSAIYLEDVFVVCWNGIQHFYPCILCEHPLDAAVFPGVLETVNYPEVLDVSVHANVHVRPVMDR